ncbi:DMT family transporter [Roseivirga sp. BDSF3-8]|uniref:DMT family transporter n=1 Tax=Roseivirga sp. BDSF3-8 TaxID=3241598 RepID=UPI0035324D4A
MNIPFLGNSRNGLAWFLLIFLALIWGSSFILIKKGLQIYSPGEVGALRIFSAAIFLMPLALKPLRNLSGREFFLLFVAGLVGSFFPAFLFAKAQTQLNSSVTGVLNALTPLFTLIFGALLFAKPINRQQSVGLSLGFIGTAILVLAGSGGDWSDLNYYAFFVVMATICYGINVNFIKYNFEGMRPLVITSVSLLSVGPIAAIYLFGFTGFLAKTTSTPGVWLPLGGILALGVVGTALALIIFNKLIKMSTPVFSSSVTYIIPIVALLWGVLDNEQLLPGHLLGTVAIILGVWLANRPKKKAQKAIV